MGQLEKDLQEQKSFNAIQKQEKERIAAAELTRKKTEQQQHWQELLHIFNNTEAADLNNTSGTRTISSTDSIEK